MYRTTVTVLAFSFCGKSKKIFLAMENCLEAVYMMKRKRQHVKLNSDAPTMETVVKGVVGWVGD